MSKKPAGPRYKVHFVGGCLDGFTKTITETLGAGCHVAMLNAESNRTHHYEYRIYGKTVIAVFTGSKERGGG